MSTKTERVRDMICICSDEGRATAARNRARALEILNTDSDGGQLLTQTTDETFISIIVAALEWNYRAGPITIACDQWLGVYATTDDKSFTAAIECDRVEDGLVGLFLTYYDRFGDVRHEARD